VCGADGVWSGRCVERTVCGADGERSGRCVERTVCGADVGRRMNGAEDEWGRGCKGSIFWFDDGKLMPLPILPPLLLPGRGAFEIEFNNLDHHVENLNIVPNSSRNAAVAANPLASTLFICTKSKMSFIISTIILKIRRLSRIPAAIPPSLPILCSQYG